MMRNRIFLSLSFISLLGLSACGSMTTTDTAAFSAQLSGANEVPRNSTPGSGRLDATLDKKTNLMTWTVSYAGLTSPVKAGHFHGPAAAGANAPVVIPFTGSLETPVSGSSTLTSAQVADLMSGKWYVNLHTATSPGGEIRGQLIPTQ